MSEKIDLGALDGMARAADRTWWIRGRDTQMVIGPGPQFGSAGLHLGPSNVDHISANSPPVTLALIARIRELEAQATKTYDATGLTVEAELVELARLVAKGTVLP